MKFLIGLCLLWALVEAAMPTNASNALYFDPLHPLTGGARTRYANRGAIKPDLNLIPSAVYFPYYVKSEDKKTYSGIMAVKRKPQGGFEVTGTLIEDSLYAKMSLLSGELIERPTHYEIALKSRNASSMMRTKKTYLEAVDFPMRLEIRTNGTDSQPRLTGALDEIGYSAFVAASAAKDVEKLWSGNFSGETLEGRWAFEMKKLGPLQVTGVAYFKSPSPNLNCAYPVYGFSDGGKNMVVVTGEDSQGRTHCDTYAWWVKGSSEYWSSMNDRNRHSSFTTSQD